MEENVIGIEGSQCESYGLMRGAAGNACCDCQAAPVEPMSESDGITAVEANEDTQALEGEELLTDEAPEEDPTEPELGEPCDAVRLDDYDDDYTYKDDAPCPGVGCEFDKEAIRTCIEDKKSSIGAIELVLPDDGNTLDYRGKKILNNNKDNVRQLLAKEDIHMYYNNGDEVKELTIPAGTRGGYIHKDCRLENSWLDSNAIAFGTVIKNCYITDSSINAHGYLENSYINDCRCDTNNELDVRNSSLFNVDFEGIECAVFKSFLTVGSVNSSRVENCRNLRGFEIVDSHVERVCDVTQFIVNCAGIKSKDDDFLQITNVGNANRTVCAYKTPRGGVRVSTGCFRGTLDELAIANAESHLGYKKAEDGYLVKGKLNPNRSSEWCYKEYDMLIKYIRHHFKLDVNTMTIPTRY